MPKSNQSENKPGKEKKKKKSVGKKFYTEREVHLREAYADFQLWTILTKAEKRAAHYPQTQVEFAKKWGVHIDTTTDWKKREDFGKRCDELFRSKMAAEVPEVIADLRKRIKKYGMGMDVELWLAYAKNWDRKKVLEIKPPVVFDDADIRNLISKLTPERQKHFRVTLAELLAEAETAANEIV